MAVAAKKRRQSKGLGRGLDALLGDVRPEAPAPVDEPKRELPIEYLTANADQPRQIFDKDAIEDLAASIKSCGLLQPILVRPRGGDNYEIVAGERRWRAAQRARLHSVPVIIRELTDGEAAEIALVENVQRVDLGPIEEANAYAHLVETYGRTQDDIARTVGKSRSHVANMMRLLKLPRRAHDALAAGEITMGHARALLAAPDPDGACARVLRDGLSVRETERLVRAGASDTAGQRAATLSKNHVKSKASGGRKDADTRALERDLSAMLGLDVAIDHSAKGAGSLSVQYRTLDQLDDICRRLMGAGV
ncbi:Chromosome (plasmid) partitioning protein ParB [hydrothermal vent metagenome]|uniref:Chromosome (Plasmid) partitioning protein ParB n=1 Tax=hydrothermal vent metagenome TaxID=652676 RepID=A0A3B0RK18_9ZZZZ